MDMTLRWFGEGVDSVSLEQIRQIPGVKGVITTLYDIPAGEEWPMERILQMKEQVEAKGLKVMGIESVNIHDAIKVGTPDREKYILKLSKAYPSMRISSWASQPEINTLKIIAKISAALLKLVLNVSATTSCLYLTGPVLIWQRYARMVLLF